MAMQVIFMFILAFMMYFIREANRELATANHKLKKANHELKKENHELKKANHELKKAICKLIAKHKEENRQTWLSKIWS